MTDNIEFYDKVRGILTACLGVEIESRQQGETALESLLISNPEEVAFVLLKLICSSFEDMERMFALILLRSRYFKHSNRPYQWEKLSHGCQKVIKVELLNQFLIQRQLNAPSKRHLSNCIAQLAIIISQNNSSNHLNYPNQEKDATSAEFDSDSNPETSALSDWPELIPFLWKVFENDDLNSHKSAFNIMRQLILESPSIFKQLHPNLLSIIEYGINSSSMLVQIECLEVICACAESMDLTFNRQLSRFLPKIASLFTEISSNPENNSHLEDIIQALIQIAQSEPRILQPHFDLLFSTVKAAITHEEVGYFEPMLIQIFTDFLIILTENVHFSKVIIRKEQSISQVIFDHRLEVIISQLIDFVFEVMKVNEDEINDDFMNPPNGTNPIFEKQFCLEQIVFGIDAIHRIFGFIGKEKLFSLLFSKIYSQLQVEENKFPGLISLGELCEYLEEKDVANNILMNVILPLLEPTNNDDMMIKCALFRIVMKFTQKETIHFIAEIRRRVIALLLDELKPVLVQRSRYVENPLPPARIIVSIIDVITAMLDSSCETEKHEIIQTRQFFQVVAILFEQNHLSYVKESCIRAIAKITTVAKPESFDRSFQITIQIINSVFFMLPDNYFCYLKVEAFTCFAQVSKQVSKGEESSKFLSFLEPTVKSMISLMDALNKTLHDLERKGSGTPYLEQQLISSWLILMENWSEELREYLKPIVQGIQDLIDKCLKDDGVYNEAVKEAILGFVEKFIEKYGQEFTPFLRISILQVIKLSDLNRRNYFFQDRCQRWVDLVMKSAKGNEELWRDILESIVKRTILMESKEENERHLNLVEIRILLEFLEINGISGIEEELLCEINSYVCEEVENHFILCRSSNSRLDRHEKTNQRQSRQDIQVEESALNCTEDEIEKYDEEQVTLSSEIDKTIVKLIWVLIKTQRSQINELIELVVKELVSKRLFRSKSIQSTKLFGIRLIECLIEGSSNDKLVQAHWIDFSKIMTELLSNDSNKIRIAAAKIIHVLVESIPADSKVAYGYIETMIRALVSSSNNINQTELSGQMNGEEYYGNEKERDVQLAREASIASIGRILKNNSAVISKEVILHWLNNLPFIVDLEESREQIVALAEVVKSKFEMFADSSELIEKAIYVLSKAVGTKMVFESLVADVNQSILILSKTTYAQQNWDRILSRISEIQQIQLNDEVKN